MNYKEKYKEIFDMEKEDLLCLIENLMKEKKLDITDITISHTRALESELSAKDNIIFEADKCIFESVFTDSLGKPADNAAMLRKLNWMEKVGMHNMQGIFEYLKTSN